MRFNIVDTERIYRRLLAEPDAINRETLYRHELIAPFEGLIQTFGGGDGLVMFRHWLLYVPDDFASSDIVPAGRREKIQGILDKLAANDAWNRALQALDEAKAAFVPYADRIPLDTIEFGLFLADMVSNPLDRGYTGFGGVPGYITTVYGEPTEYNLHRLKGATVHELHHNVRFSIFPFTLGITVGEYIIAEGLAESFAAELYGEDVVGYYVTDFNEADLSAAKSVIGGALDVTGFNTVRGYVFGDTLAAHGGFPEAGVPDYAGYAIGYRVVQKYLAHTGKTVAEATFVPARRILAESGFFA